jgi:hypothetical protein
MVGSSTAGVKVPLKFNEELFLSYLHSSPALLYFIVFVAFISFYPFSYTHFPFLSFDCPIFLPPPFTTSLKPFLPSAPILLFSVFLSYLFHLSILSSLLSPHLIFFISSYLYLLPSKTCGTEKHQ